MNLDFRRSARVVRRWLPTILVTLCASPVRAIPPIVSGDVPAAGKGVYELFVGYLLVNSGDTEEHQVPFWELVYGATERQDLTLEAPLIFLDGPDGSTLGIGDVVLGTKYRIVGSPSSDAGLSASLEVKLPSADRSPVLGSGATDVNLRARWGWELGRQVVYVNLGHVWVGEHGDERRDKHLVLLRGLGSAAGKAGSPPH